MNDAPSDPAPAEPPPSPLVFPTDFPIKIMGLNRLEFEPQIVAIVRRHAPDLDDTMVEVRQSSAGKYLSLTVTVRAQSRVQLDAIYMELTGHPLVKVVL
jgi:putative lipoic acid-binding regulatory protein